MSTYGEKLAAAREKRPSKDVQVCFDGELAVAREALLAELDEAKKLDAVDARLATPSNENEMKVRERLEQLSEAAQDALVTFRFTRIPGKEWASLTSRHPVRVDVPIDRHYGYNYDAVCEAAARFVDPKTQQAFGQRVEGDEFATLSDEEWSETFDVLSGSEIGLIRDAIWELNEWEPQQRLAQLVKGFGAATRSDTK